MAVNIMIRVTIKRVSNKDSIPKMLKQLAPKVTKGLEAVADHLRWRSQELVPPDTQALVTHCKVREFEQPFSVYITVGYGTKGQTVTGFSEAEQRYITVMPEKYAVFVHEDVTMQHPRGGQAEFLRTPLLQDFQEMRAIFLAAATTK